MFLKKTVQKLIFFHVLLPKIAKYTVFLLIFYEGNISPSKQERGEKTNPCRP